MELTIIDPKEFGIEESKAKLISDQFKPMLDKMVELEVEANEVFSLDINDKESAKKAKELRLKYVKVRTGTAEIHKAQKAFYLQAGRFVDGWKNAQLFASNGIEEKLEAIEKHFENLEKQKAKDLNDARIERLRPFVEDVTGLDFAPMNDEDFDDYLLGKKTRFENAQKEAEAEAQRVENERLKTIETNRRRNLQAPYSVYLDLSHLDISELSLEEFEAVLEQCKKAKIEFDKKQAEIVKENERLRKEAEAKEKALEIERAKAKAEADRIEAENNAKLEAQRKETARITKELQDKKYAELKAENDRLAKEKSDKLEAEKLAKAPIKKQLSVWVNCFEIALPPVANETTLEIAQKFEAFKKWSINQINNL